MVVEEFDTLSKTGTMFVLIISISYLFTKWLSNVKSMGYNADTMKRIAVGIILIAGGVAWAIINHDGPIVILPIAMIIFGFVLFVFGARHLWISRR